MERIVVRLERLMCEIILEYTTAIYYLDRSKDNVTADFPSALCCVENPWQAA